MSTFNVPAGELVRGAQEPVRGIPVRGYITQEDDQHIWLRDQNGTWLISKGDVAITKDWDGAADPRYTGKPVLLFIREGADIYELKRFTVQIMTRPITLQQLAHGTGLRVKGDEVVPTSADEPSEEIGFRPGTGVLATMRMQGHVTVCCWDSNWGTTCQGDDSGE